MVSAQTYDAIVVGSGMTGGWAAKELTEAGLRTLVLEREVVVKRADELGIALIGVPPEGPGAGA